MNKWIKKQQSRYRIDENTGCWNWIGTKNRDGYGILNRDYKRYFAHRVFYENYKGQIPDNTLVCHTCDNPACVNPEHLWIGSINDNNQDKVEKNRQGRTGTKGNNYGEHNGTTKLTEEQVLFLRDRTWKIGDIQKYADLYGVSYYTIHSIKSKQTWKYLNK